MASRNRPQCARFLGSVQRHSLDCAVFIQTAKPTRSCSSSCMPGPATTDRYVDRRQGYLLLTDMQYTWLIIGTTVRIATVATASIAQKSKAVKTWLAKSICWLSGFAIECHLTSEGFAKGIDGSQPVAIVDSVRLACICAECTKNDKVLGTCEDMLYIVHVRSMSNISSCVTRAWSPSAAFCKAHRTCEAASLTVA